MAKKRKTAKTSFKLRIGLPKGSLQDSTSLAVVNTGGRSGIDAQARTAVAAVPSATHRRITVTHRRITVTPYGEYGVQAPTYLWECSSQAPPGVGE